MEPQMDNPYQRTNRRHEDPWNALIEDRLSRVEERIEKNTMMVGEMLEAWDTVRGGFKALEFLAKAVKVLGMFLTGCAAVWVFVKHFLRVGG